MGKSLLKHGGCKVLCRGQKQPVFHDKPSEGLGRQNKARYIIQKVAFFTRLFLNESNVQLSSVRKQPKFSSSNLIPDRTVSTPIFCPKDSTWAKRV